MNKSVKDTVAENETIEFFLNPAPYKYIVQEDGFKYTGAIIIPENAKRRPTTGTVVAVGKGLEESMFQIGTKVVYGVYSGTVLNFKGQPAFRVLGEDEILASVIGEPVFEGSGT